MNASELRHGHVYDCCMDGNKGAEKTTIVPLAIDAGERQRFIIVGAKELMKAAPAFFRKLVAMSFLEIVDEDIVGGPDRQWSAYVWRFSIVEHGELYFEDFDLYLYGFVETGFCDSGNQAAPPPRNVPQSPRQRDDQGSQSI